MASAKMYFVAIVLPPELDAKALLYKRHMAEKYGCKVGLKSPAHITLIPPFWMGEEKEPVLLLDVQAVAQTASSFAAKTAGFSSFPPRTLFVAVEPNEALQTLKQKIDECFGATAYGVRPDPRPFHPHVTIATRDIRKKDFWEAWEVLKAKEFAQTFTADALSVLRHNGARWDVIYTAVFTQAGQEDFSTPR